MKARASIIAKQRNIPQQPKAHASKPLRLKGLPPKLKAEKAEVIALQRVADLEFALSEMRGGLRKVLLHLPEHTSDTQAAIAIGQCRVYAEEGLLRADNALGMEPPKRRAGDKPDTFRCGVKDLELHFNSRCGDGTVSLPSSFGELIGGFDRA